MDNTINIAPIARIGIIRSLIPSINITSPASNAVIDSSFTVSGNASCIYLEKNTGSDEEVEFPADGDITNVAVRVGDSGTFQQATPTGPGGSWTSWDFTTGTTLGGTQIITAQVTAARGTLIGTATDTQTVTIDRTPPTLTVQSSTITTSTNTAIIQGTANDPASGVDFVEWQLGNSAFVRASGTTTWASTVTVPGLGSYTVSVRARDRAGNLSATQTITIVAVDSTPPVLEIVSPLEGAEFTLVNGTVTVEFQGTAIDTQTGVSIVEWDVDGLNQYKPAIPKAANDWSTWRVSIPMTTAGNRTVSFRAKDKTTQTGNPTVKTRSVNILLPFIPKDPLAIFSQATYLDELLLFATRRIKTAAAAASPLITVPQLAQTFLQPLDVLATPNARLVANQSVHQVRICLEVLRRYFARNNRSTPANAETNYRQSAYKILLRNLGTSYEELRLTRIGDEKTRKALASRMGIELTPVRPDRLDRLLLQPNQITEAVLERLFGLVDTTRDPLTTGVLPVPELLVWQKEHLRAQWQQQDNTAQSDVGTPLPIIDPDVIGESDLKDPVPGNPAYDLWKARQQQLANQLAAIEATREAQATPLAGFDRIVSDLLGPIAALVALAEEQKRGNNIDAQLKAKQIALQPFRHLMYVRNLAVAGTILDEEWADVYAILVQVQKLRQSATWRQQEGTLTLGPDYFQLPDATPPTALPQWRATQQARLTWKDVLTARMQQEQIVVEALQVAVDATEAATLPVLRDALVNDLLNANDPKLDSLDEVANRLSQELAIDCKSSGNQKITRIEQALETAQAILFSARMGQFNTPPVLGTTNPAASWVLNPANGYTESKFDEEWQWMGAYATWRASMFVFGYPENYLLPSLRPSQNQNPNQALSRTPAFNTLITNLRDNLRLTPAQARTEAQTYLDTLRVQHSDLPAELKNTAFKITDQLSETELIQRQTLIQGLFGMVTNPYQASKYLWEVFYFVPMALGLQLQKSSQYLASLDWLQTVYAYNLPVNQRKIYRGLTLEGNLTTDFSRADDWLIQGLNPHDIASKRANVYTRFSLMSLIRCFLDFADSEFTRSTNESLPRARSLYVSALELLSQPEMQPPIGSPNTPANPFPPNPVLQSLKLHAELNLFKLRNGRNIAGLERQSGTLVTQAGTLNGSPVLTSNGQLNIPKPTTLRPTSYRYAVLIERAKQLVTIAQQIEAAFLAALEKLDAESYNLLKARHDMQLSRAGVRLQDLRITEAEGGVTLAQLQQQRSQIQTNHYDGLIDEGLIGLEQTAIGFMVAAAVLHTSAGIIYGGDAILNGVKAAFTFGLFGDPGASLGAMASSLAQAASTTASILETYASYERREQEWRFQRDLSRQDEIIGDQQIEIAQDQVRVVQQESFIAGMQADFAEDTLAFLANKFTNAELYEWMSGILERVYSYFLQQATAMAQLAENQLAFERQENPPAFIQADYWQTPGESGTVSGTENQRDRRGLTGSARLLQDIFQLDQYAFETNRRKLQLTQTFSLSQLAPIEFQRFRETGRLLFATPMELFDRDFPGHYLRLIKRIRISVIALTPPTRGIRATLTTSGLSRVVVGGDLFQTIVVRRDPEQIAFTSPSNATGLFELERETEMLLPFESMGVDTTWELQMPKAANPFDFSTIADVLVTIEYTALSSLDYRQQVIKSLNPDFSADRPISLRSQFPDQWYDLHNPNKTVTPLTVKFKTLREDFPPNLDDLSIQQVVMYFVRSRDATYQTVEVSRFSFTADGSTDKVGGAATSIDDIISTRRGNASSWTATIGKSPFGEWELSFPDNPQMRELFTKEQFEDILLVITYKGRSPAWPQ
ncbi:OmpL47-type beta-barrel domain-containing protein [Pseudanabaena sp. PCC 6802]|uniref:Tc toxin subunit A-related protein n=1 Tax=Pseudanabaena sp. PCC 6802 TaxID=118173 RepID=UPI00034B651D|nr:neuraminidase-like domain-containing protein [Pseudanabaena sp. PCC 6802]